MLTCWNLMFSVFIYNCLLFYFTVVSVAQKITNLQQFQCVVNCLFCAIFVLYMVQFYNKLQNVQDFALCHWVPGVPQFFARIPCSFHLEVGGSKVGTCVASFSLSYVLIVYSFLAAVYRLLLIIMSIFLHISVCDFTLLMLWQVIQRCVIVSVNLSFSADVFGELAPASPIFVRF